MTKDEALHLALEALENLGNHDRVCPQWPTYAEPENYPKCNCGYDQAITAIKAALEAKDEPEYYGLTKDHLWMSISKEHYDRLKPEFRMACYTTPPQRTWVGLTNEEIASVEYNNHPLDGIRSFARAIEAKLKEKNS